MSWDQTIKWMIIGAVAAIDVVLLRFCPFITQWHELLLPAGCAVLLIGLSIHYHRRSEERLVVCMVTMLQLGGFTSVVTLLVYAVLSLQFPLADWWLAAADQALGYSSRDVVGVVKSMPLIDQPLLWAYHFIVPETLWSLLALSILKERQRLEQFVMQFMVAILVCAICACLFPALGPAYQQGITPSQWQTRYIDQILALRSGDPYLFSWQAAEGLVTFPSFHTTWAVMLVLLWRGQAWYLKLPVAMISLMIVISTLTTGAHYLVDVIGGLVLAWVSYQVSRFVTRISYDSDGNPKRLFMLPSARRADWVTSRA